MTDTTIVSTVEVVNEGPRCESCQWWRLTLVNGYSIPRQDPSQWWGQCLLASTGEHVDDPDSMPDTLAIASDHYGDSARLETRACFGCIQHKPRG